MIHANGARYQPSFRKSEAYFSRCELRLTIANDTRKWRKIFFYLSLSSRGPWIVFQIFQLYDNLNSWSNYFVCCDGSGLSRLCFTLGADIFLGGHSNYQSFFSYSCDWWRFGYMIVGGLCRWKSNPNSILFSSFSYPFCGCSIEGCSSSFPTSDWKKEPLGCEQ